MLEAVVPGPIDEAVRDRIVAETHGNPLALLELPRGMSAAELAGGYAVPASLGSFSGLEDGFRRRLDALPPDTLRLVQLAAADPVGEPLLVWRAAERLGIPAEAATPAVEADLLEIRAQVRFHHPLVRSAAYRSASPAERRALHAALAEATDVEAHPDRRAWHRAQAAAGPDEAVADELERSAVRAQARGGIAASAAFLESAATLTPEPAERVRRLFAAAHAKRDAGALEEALHLLTAAEAGPITALQAAEAEHLRGDVAFDQRRVGDAARLLGGAARRLEPLDPELARATHLEALGAAIWAADLDSPGALVEAAEAARAAPPAPDPAGPVDVVLDALALRLGEGHAAAAPELKRALATVLAVEAPAADLGQWLWLTGARATGMIALELWDVDAWHTLSSRQVQVARDSGALVQLQFALNFFARSVMASGELAEAAVLVEEERAIGQAMGNPAVGYVDLMLAAWRGEERLASAADRADDAGGERARPGPDGRHRDVREGGPLQRHRPLRRGVRRRARGVRAPRPRGTRTVRRRRAGRGGIEDWRPAARSRPRSSGCRSARAVTRTDWVLGIEARVRALLAEGDAAEREYRESIACLGRTRLRMELARGHLLYGEWLRRDARRMDAREQLRTAHELFAAIGAHGFAERARHELLATGETVRKRTEDTRDDLTPQEEHIARLAVSGRTNPEIGAELFISPRTVEWHLKKVFTKLGITSRRGLRDALPARAGRGRARVSRERRRTPWCRETRVSPGCDDRGNASPSSRHQPRATGRSET